jgi:HEAT repeat protein
MKNRPYLFLTVLLFAAVAAALWWSPWEQSEPVYDGKPLRYWLARDFEPYPSAISSDSKAVPILITAMNEKKMTLLRMHYEELWSKMPLLIQKHLRPPLNLVQLKKQRHFAVTVLGGMGPLASPAIPGLVRALNDSYADVRAAAIVSLARLGQADPRVTTALGAALCDDKPEMCFYAALTLRRLGHTNEAVMRELTSPLKDPDPKLRAARASAMQNIGQADHVIVAALITASEDADPSVRRDTTVALGSLGRLGETEAVSKALTARLKDEDSFVRRVAAESLGQLGHVNPAATAALMDLLQNENVGRTRVLVAQALLQLGQENASLTSYLVAALTDPDQFVRTFAAAACGVLRQSDERVNAALALVLNDGFIPAHLSAADSLSRLGQGDAALVQVLAGALNSPLTNVQNAALGYLRDWVGHPEHRGAIVRALGADPDPGIRAQAAWLMGRVGEPEPAVLAALNRASQDPNAQVREAASNALAKLAPEAVVKAGIKPKKL